MVKQYLSAGIRDIICGQLISSPFRVEISFWAEEFYEELTNEDIPAFMLRKSGYFKTQEDGSLVIYDAGLNCLYYCVKDA